MEIHNKPENGRSSIPDQQSELSVHIRNEAVDTAEKVTMMSPMYGDQITRSATLRMAGGRLQLLCTHYASGDTVTTGDLSVEAVRCFSVGGKLSREEQKAHGFIQGAVFGAVGFGFGWFVLKDAMKVSTGEYIAIAIIGSAIISLVYGLFSLSNVTKSDLVTVSFEAIDGDNLSFEIEESELENVLKWAKDSGFETNIKSGN